jgi:hypothetical protein
LDVADEEIGCAGGDGDADEEGEGEGGSVEEGGEAEEGFAGRGSLLEWWRLLSCALLRRLMGAEMFVGSWRQSGERDGGLAVYAMVMSGGLMRPQTGGIV